jgi:hypothetical protein
VLPRQEFFTKEIRRLLHGGENEKWPAIHSLGEGWSQSPVLPRTQRADETHLSAGSTAKLEPSPGMDFPSFAGWMLPNGRFAFANCVVRPSLPDPRACRETTKA